jgi:uncharacterized protein (TIGR02246 family)
MSREELLSVLNGFCAAFAHRDAGGVMRLLAPDVLMITSEEPLLRGREEVSRFLDGYVEGPTTYSWEWEHHDVSVVGRLAWLLAKGVETATTGERQEKHPYRMTMVCENRDERWMIRQVHGSSPHPG